MGSADAVFSSHCSVSLAQISTTGIVPSPLSSAEFIRFAQELPTYMRKRVSPSPNTVKGDQKNEESTYRMPPQKHWFTH